MTEVIDDINDINPSARMVTLRHPATDEPLGIKVEMLPRTDKKVAQVERAWQNSRLNSKSKQLTMAQVDAFRKDLLCVACVGWEWTPGKKFDGEELEFSEQNLRRIMQKRFIFEQLDDELGREADFYRSSETT